MLIIISWMVSGMISVGMFASPLSYQYETQSHFCALTPTNFVTAFVGNVVIAIIPIILHVIIVHHPARHTRINPNSVRAKRNKTIFQRMLIFIALVEHVIFSVRFFTISIEHLGHCIRLPIYSWHLLLLLVRLHFFFLTIK